MNNDTYSKTKKHTQTLHMVVHLLFREINILLNINILLVLHLILIDKIFSFKKAAYKNLICNILQQRTKSKSPK